MSGDFILSVLIFLIAMSIIIPGFLRVSEGVRADEARRDLELAAIFSSDALVKTTGFPEDWNSTNVVTAGLIDDKKINLTKVRTLMDMDYSTASRVLGLGGYGFNLTFSDVSGYGAMSGFAESPAAYFYAGDSDLWDTINSSGIVWDIYYGGAGSPETGTSRNVYTGQAVDVFNSMVGNASLYKTIIIEEPGLTQGQINIAQLQGFVDRGGLLVFEGSADLIETGFSMHGFSGAAGSGTVVSKDEFTDALVGSAVTFTNPTWYFQQQSGDSQLIAIVEDASSNTVIGRWLHGFGEIYYITDLEGTAGTAALSSVFHPVGKIIEAGGQAQGAATVSVTHRFGILGGKNQPVKITILVWI